MSNFKIKKPLPNFNNKKEVKLNNFSQGADTHEVLDIGLDRKAKPNKSFTVPLNEYELSLLRKVSQKAERSQRYMCRKLLVKTLEEEVEKV